MDVDFAPVDVIECVVVVLQGSSGAVVSFIVPALFALKVGQKQYIAF